MDKDESGLAKDAIGLWGLVFYSISVILPGGAFAITGAAAIIYGGYSAPLAFILGGLAVFLSVIPVYFFSQYISSAGGYYKYIESSIPNKYLSKSVGFWQVFWVVGDMIAASSVIPWLSWAYSALFHVSLPLDVVLLLSLVIPVSCLLVSYFGISLSSRITIVVGTLQIAFFSVLGVALLLKSRHPSPVLRVEDFHSLFLSMVVGALLAYSGYGSIISLGEEAKLSRKTIKRAVMVSVSIMVLFFSFVVYSIVASAGPDLPVAQAQLAPGIYVTEELLGERVSSLALAIVLFSQVITSVLFGSSGARTVYSLAQDGFFPDFLKVTRRNGSPFRATAFIIGLGMIGSLSTIVPLILDYGVGKGLFYSFTIWATVITVLFLFIQIVTNMSLPFFLRRRGMKVKVLDHLLPSITGSSILVVALYYSLQNLDPPLNLIYFILVGLVITPLVMVYALHDSIEVEESPGGARPNHEGLG
ncbi:MULTISPECIES: APC family permease [Metallosphaera]|uniref:Amino acid/polyamine/organocation transporter, APC superfamily n=3 Tax=Metallosphaera TaxID=41980 RepID=A4YFZ1_METS5|nr:MULTISPECIES: APC family permease [Metallosphaera]ABP95343.1 amino acid/polyamine/organocation transporter, APC superfamily [Metallosphaera sedula DSM 5348]AIM27329.1 amino acid/polyamine/organocation transporter, APC superfamily [Metallosphaera sedula]AKV74209.1 hypothetical protein MsedA_1198 [Metallosphaera sedula]AKV76448.1 hypothetical protein MsedB_1200 [Metallosphaera sedula]AKV78700.1 hypothetical protein MsedC_1198 [Metallosphaera sedula]